MTKKNRRNPVFLFLIYSLLLFSLSACGNSNSSGASNLVCANIESYLSTKAMVLADAARGDSAVVSIDYYVGALADGLNKDPIAISIFDPYFASMKEWAAAVDQYRTFGDKSVLRQAAFTLEKDIDSLVPKCEASGWKFESGWR
jgi:hypothetical protein